MNKRFIGEVALRVGVCIAILAAGVLGMTLLRLMKESPAQAEIRERAIRVDVKKAAFEDVQVKIAGYGEVRARDVVSVAPEVAGRVVAVHPRLEVGEIIPAGEVLFTIDQRDYAAQTQDAAAKVEQLEASIERLRKQYAIDKSRLETLRRNRELAAKEFERVQELFSKDQVGTLSGVDQAEMAANQASDQVDQLSQVVDLYPIRIREAESTLTSAQAMQEMAQANFSRTEVSVPFAARLRTVQIEEGQYVNPGQMVLECADDSILEISVPLDSREARRWLRFGEERSPSEKAWFNALEQVPVEVYWTEAPEESCWNGTLHRVEKFDQQTRTLTVVIRIEGNEARESSTSDLPLVEGMFCSVKIPGRPADRVVKLPTEAVGFDETGNGERQAYLAVEKDGEYRLKSIMVTASHIEGSFIYIKEGLEAGDLVVLTRLINPLENSLLEVNVVESEGSAS